MSVNAFLECNCSWQCLWQNYRCLPEVQLIMRSTKSILKAEADTHADKVCNKRQVYFTTHHILHIQAQRQGDVERTTYKCLQHSNATAKQGVGKKRSHLKNLLVFGEGLAQLITEQKHVEAHNACCSDSHGNCHFGCNSSSKCLSDMQRQKRQPGGVHRKDDPASTLHEHTDTEDS